jgi:hypothetical protein
MVESVQEELEELSPNEKRGQRVVSTVEFEFFLLVSCTYYLPKLKELSGLSPRALVIRLRDTP